MAEYGVTKNGLNIKRLDEIQREIHEDLTAGWGVNTQLNPESFLGVLITDFADKIAELWEVGAGIYHSMYPSTAEGTNLDYAAQFGGSTRELAARTYYPVHCKGIDGTELFSGTTISSSTSPKKLFTTTDASMITREKCNEIAVKTSYVGPGDYSISINGEVSKFTASSEHTAVDIIAGLDKSVASTGFNHRINEAGDTLVISSKDRSRNNAVLLSDNLTTEYVTSIITFASEEMGNIVQPDGTITEIVTAVAGLLSVWNEGSRTSGRLRESDEEFRASYIDKIYSRSSRMCESVTSSLLNVPGVKSAAAYENVTNYTYLTLRQYSGLSGSKYICFEGIFYEFTVPAFSLGDELSFSTEHKTLTQVKENSTSDVPLKKTLAAPSGKENDITERFKSEIFPHSIEVVVDGGDDSEVAKTILDTKAAGINTYGDVSVDVPDVFDGRIAVRFNRPANVYIWYNIKVTKKTGEAMPPNYTDLIEDIILQKMDAFSAGTDVTPQEWMGDIYRAVTGIAYIDILMAKTSDPHHVPELEEYKLRSITITKREKAVSDPARIGVAESG